MDTLHDRLAELADDAPTGGAPAAELWARGKRAQRLRATALAATLLLVSAGGIGIGGQLADGDGGRTDTVPARTVGIALPIEYPIGKELPKLGNAPGPLAAIWVSPGAGDGALGAVGLVAGTATFGTLPIDLSYDDRYEAHDPGVALSPDGRRIAYESSKGELSIRDLVSGDSYSPPSGFRTRAGYTWVDATTLIGHVAGGSDIDGWVWEPGTALKLVNLMSYTLPPDASWFAKSADGPGTRDWWVTEAGGGPGSCSSPILENRSGGRFEFPVLCDVLGFDGWDILLGHWKDPNDGNGTVVALYFVGFDALEDPANRRVVVTAGAPERVTFATELIGKALEGERSAS